VVHVRLLNHRAHRFRDAPLFELVPAVLLPDGLAVEVRPAELRAEEDERTRVRERRWAWRVRARDEVPKARLRAGVCVRRGVTRAGGPAG
jgi:hypothetical protein